MHLESEHPQVIGEVIGDVGWEDFLRHTRLILALVVEDLVLRHDLSDRKGLVPDDPDRELPTGMVALEEHEVAPRHTLRDDGVMYA